MALKSALNAKLRDNQIIVISDARVESHKTKDFVSVIKKLKLNPAKIRLVAVGFESNVRLATRNIPKFFLTPCATINALEVIDCNQFVITKNALLELQKRVKQCLK